MDVWVGEQRKFEDAKRKKKYVVDWPEGCEKYGAGFVFCCGTELLLLKRSATSGNALTWGLPGGNVDYTDASLLYTAERESREELGKLPENYQVLQEFVTKRGKRLQKWYKVFLAKISEEEKERYKPNLNYEHVEYKWVDVDNLKSLELHPVVQLLLKDSTFSIK